MCTWMCIYLWLHFIVLIFNVDKQNDTSGDTARACTCNVRCYLLLPVHCFRSLDPSLVSSSPKQNKNDYIPSWELTYPTLGKGKSSSKCHFWGDMLVPWRVSHDSELGFHGSLVLDTDTVSPLPSFTPNHHTSWCDLNNAWNGWENQLMTFTMLMTLSSYLKI